MEPRLLDEGRNLTQLESDRSVECGVEMAGFRFNFDLPDNVLTDNRCPGHASSGDNTSASDSSSSFQSLQSTLSSDSCELNEVSVQPFHEQLLDSISPIRYSVKLTRSSSTIPSPSPPPTLPTSLPLSQLSHGAKETVTLHYITSDQLQSLLDTERDLNLKSATEASVHAHLSSELGPLVGITDSAHSDLIPEVYEGGMKVWECAYDLVDYLATEDTVPLCGRRVLELGCGIGLPGTFALLCGAECVHFQDFNREVLSCLTIPSVLASIKSGQPKLNSGRTEIADQTSINTSDAQSELNRDSLGSKAKFYYGDWGDFVQGRVTSGGLPYDIILTSETIYSVPSQPKLLQALKLLTNQSTGLVVVAAKAHYFGVGGSVQMFQDLVTQDGHFQISVGRSIEASVPRQILLLQPKTVQP